jgi:hypothetical protein
MYVGCEVFVWRRPFLVRQFSIFCPSWIFSIDHLSNPYGCRIRIAYENLNTILGRSFAGLGHSWLWLIGIASDMLGLKIGFALAYVYSLTAVTSLAQNATYRR